jgi:hypothetical protein
MDEEGQRNFGAALKSAGGPKGFDIVIDPVGGPYAEPALRAVGWRGRYLVVGFTAGIPRLPLNLPLLKGCDIRGIFWGDELRRDPTAFARQIGAMLCLIFNLSRYFSFLRSRVRSIPYSFPSSHPHVEPVFDPPSTARSRPPAPAAPNRRDRHTDRPPLAAHFARRVRTGRVRQGMHRAHRQRCSACSRRQTRTTVRMHPCL